MIAYNHKLKFESTINARKICGLLIFFCRTVINIIIK